MPSNPLPAAALRRRAGLVVTAVGLAWLVLAGRLIQLQVIQRADLHERAERQRQVIEEIPSRPGDIFDTQGRLLATTVKARSLFLVPSRIPNPSTVAERLAFALPIDADQLFAQLSARSEQHFVWVRRRLTEDEVQHVRDLNLPAEIWGFREEFRRVYPQGKLAAQVLGLRDIDGLGHGGVEESCEPQLRGLPGQRVLNRDARGRVIDIAVDEEQMPRDGTAVTLTLDCVIQLFAERTLDKLVAEWQPDSCCAIVLDPKTGDVLAMASRPDFDPNQPSEIPDDAWKNRAVSDIYEPGSTMKPMIVAYGLDRGLIAKDDAFNCEWGRYWMGRRLLHDHHPYGSLSLTDVLVKSSNIGMAKVGERLTNAGLHEAATLFGFGRATGIELSGELPGVLRPLDRWTSYSTGSVPMGHEIAVTPLQLITAHATIANGGLLVRPRLVKTASDTGSNDFRHLTPRVISEDVARWLVQNPMRDVVTRGTGRKAQIPGYDVFGKTGTAQCLSPKGGYLHNKHLSSFVCGAPAEDPQLMVLVVV
ncbi:MAG TPA: penicillin-binding protein 2, partial [Planctomycetaceae bacterium]|nr:penicillin-binding protein 2 [Planctomycetaceae bacterium]